MKLNNIQQNIALFSPITMKDLKDVSRTTQEIRVTIGLKIDFRRSSVSLYSLCTSFGASRAGV